MEVVTRDPFLGSVMSTLLDMPICHHNMPRANTCVQVERHHLSSLIYIPSSPAKTLGGNVVIERCLAALKK